MAALMPKFVLDHATVKSDLTVFKRRFKNFLVANKVDADDKVQVAYLQLALDQASVDLISVEENDSVELLLKKLEEALLPKENIILTQFKFFQRQQNEGEPVDAFIAELKTLIKECGFADQEENILKVRIVLGINDVRLQERLLRYPDLKLSEVINHCRATEQAAIGLEVFTKKQVVEAIDKKDVMAIKGKHVIDLIRSR